MGRLVVSMLRIPIKNKAKSHKTQTQTIFDEKGKRGELVQKYQNSGGSDHDQVFKTETLKISFLVTCF